MSRTIALERSSFYDPGWTHTRNRLGEGGILMASGSRGLGGTARCVRVSVRDGISGVDLAEEGRIQSRVARHAPHVPHEIARAFSESPIGGLAQHLRMELLSPAKRRVVRPARRDQGAAREHEGRGADGRLPLSAPADHGVHPSRTPHIFLLHNITSLLVRGESRSACTT